MRYISDKNTLSKQVWLGDSKPCKEKFVKNFDINIVSNKPKGGFWTSSLKRNSKITSEWIDYYKDSDLDKYEECFIYLLEPNYNLKIIEIDSKKDLDKLYEEYGDTMDLIDQKVDYIDYNKVREDNFDCIRLTFEGQEDLEDYSFRDNLLSTWDCESTLWLKFKFKNVQRTETMHKF